MPYQGVYKYQDFSGGVQSATSNLLRERNEVFGSVNATYNKKIGAVARRDGYEQVGPTIVHGADGLGLHIYRYGNNNKIVVGTNNLAGTYATLKFYNKNIWSEFLTTAPLNTRFNIIDYLEEMYVAGSVPGGHRMTLTNIDSTLTASTTRNVLHAPKCAYAAEYNGQLWAINCEIGNKVYSDRAYRSSAPLGAVTYIRGDQSGMKWQMDVDSVRYLKVGMTVDIYRAGTDNKVMDSLFIRSVDKNNERISFTNQIVDLKDNDEIWLEDRKGQLSILWNTDYPTPEDSDYLRVPPGMSGNPAYTGYGICYNRLFLFTENSTMKWDGANLQIVSNMVGCVSHETIQAVGSWLIWLHGTGVWGYNGANGQLKLLSRGVQNYIDAINQSNLPKASAVAMGQLYKLAVGEIAVLDSATTSTSTSSTSTSSTSSSTSSTSTSSTSCSTSTTTVDDATSTSTSSTSSSTSSTSTSSTSASTSSTSQSTSTSSTSTSSTSSSTSTVASSKECVRLVLDMDMDAWWIEKHRREMRFQKPHTMHGYTKPYFMDETGRLFRDDTGYLDHFDTIPFEVETNNSNFGYDLSKTYNNVVVDSERPRSVQVLFCVDDGEWNVLGQLDATSKSLTFPAMTRGRKLKYKFTHNDAGEPPIINGITTFFAVEERRQ